jgi:hypothetical protein
MNNMNIEDLVIDWEHIYDFLMKYNQNCSKKDFVETMEEMKEYVIFENKKDLETARKEYKNTQPDDEFDHIEL